MANTKSAQKRARQNIKVNAANRVQRSIVRTSFKKVIVAIEKNDLDNAALLFRSAESKMQSAVSKGLYKKNTSARKISRLNKLLKQKVLAVASAA